jgi:hypothetical protein
LHSFCSLFVPSLSFLPSDGGHYRATQADVALLEEKLATATSERQDLMQRLTTTELALSNRSAAAAAHAEANARRGLSNPNLAGKYYCSRTSAVVLLLLLFSCSRAYRLVVLVVVALFFSS